ncbi:hypothetical protein AYI68_g6959, partial [Smittium mucronatum]
MLSFLCRNYPEIRDFVDLNLITLCIKDM